MNLGVPCVTTLGPSIETLEAARLKAVKSGDWTDYTKLLNAAGGALCRHRRFVSAESLDHGNDASAECELCVAEEEDHQ